MRSAVATALKLSDWLGRLPTVIREVQARWSLTLGAPFDHDEVSCVWVAPVTRPDGSPAVLKVSMPHFEAEHEIAGLRFWNGDPTVCLVEADEQVGAMLIEQCVLEVDSERVRMWMFARLAAEPRDDWRPNDLTELARMLSP